MGVGLLSIVLGLFLTFHATFSAPMDMENTGRHIHKLQIFTQYAIATMDYLNNRQQYSIT